MNYIYNKQKQTLTAIILLSLIISSCNKSKSKLGEYGPVFENVMKSNNGVFRGYSLGDKLDSVKAKEQGKPTELESNYVYYEYKIDTSASYNITYTFDEDGLSEIQSDIYIINSKNTEEVFNKFKMYFDKNYGDSNSHQGYTVWTVKSEKFGVVRINLSDASATLTADKAPGKISLWIYPDKE